MATYYLYQGLQFIRQSKWMAETKPLIFTSTTDSVAAELQFEANTGSWAAQSGMIWHIPFS